MRQACRARRHDRHLSAVSRAAALAARTLRKTGPPIPKARPPAPPPRAGGSRRPEGARQPPLEGARASGRPCRRIGWRGVGGKPRGLPDKRTALLQRLRIWIPGMPSPRAAARATGRSEPSSPTHSPDRMPPARTFLTRPSPGGMRVDPAGDGDCRWRNRQDRVPVRRRHLRGLTGAPGRSSPGSPRWMMSALMKGPASSGRKVPAFQGTRIDGSAGALPLA